MEERKLNFNAPLLSVRRFSAAIPSPKGEKGCSSALRRRHSLPSNTSDAGSNQVKGPVTVPFTWEHIPGKAKDSTVPEEEASVAPRLPPGMRLDVVKYSLEQEFQKQDAIRSQVAGCSANETVTKIDTSNEGKNEKWGCESEHDEEDYADALDTLSPSDSFSWNCSTSGISGSGDTAVKPSGSFSADPHTRDFMMGRFLPAAKAMASEPPPYASTKKHLSVEQPREAKKMVVGDRKSSINLYKSRYDRGLDVEEIESEDEDYNASGNVSIKGCGLFPRLCSKNSFYLLNSVPGLKVRTLSSVPSLSQVRQPDKAAYREPHNHIVKKYASYKQKVDSVAQSTKLLQTVNKPSSALSQFTKSSDQQPKSDGGVQCHELSKTENKLISVSSRYTKSSDQQLTRSSSRISPYRRERHQSPFRGGGFLGIPKGAENFKAKSPELSSHQCFNQGSDSASPAVEKTLYVDTENFAEPSSFNSNSSVASRVVEEFATAESSLESKTSGHNRGLMDDTSNLRGQTEMVRCVKQDGGHDLEARSLHCVKVCTENNLKADDREEDYKRNPNPAAHPPLPKTPSESWLRRTLPSVSSQNSLMRSYTGSRFHSKKEELKAASATAKWETIVKTSHLHLDHVRYSEELVTHVSQQPRT